MVVEKDQEVNEPKKDEDQKLEAAKPVSAAAAEPENLAHSSIQIDKDMKTPKQIYMEKTEGKQAAGHADDLVALYDLGFVCFDTNLALLKKYQDLAKVIDILLSGGLNQSAIDCLFQGGEEE